MDFLIIGLAAFRLASLLVNEDGPFSIFARLRSAAGVPQGAGEIPDGLLPGIFSCVWCAGVWTALVAWGLWQLEPAIDSVLAAASIVILVQKVVDLR